MLKKILKIFAFLILGLVVALAALPYVFKDRILAEVKKVAEEQVNARVDFKDIDVSFFRSFPNLNIKIIDLSITGIDTFEEIVLLRTDELALDTDLSPLFNKKIKPSIKYFGLANTDINLETLSDGTVNWDILKNKESSNYKIDVTKYEITNGNLTYTDHQKLFVTQIKGCNHAGKGTFESMIFDLNTTTEAKELSVWYNEILYLNKVKTKLEAKINVDKGLQKFTLKENILSLNDLDATGDGFVQFIKDDIITEFNFKTKSETFKNFISVLPMLNDYNKVAANGTASIGVNVHGLYNGEQKKFPAFELNVDIDNGSAKYQALPKSIHDIFAKIEVSATRSDMSDLKINIPKLNAKIGDDVIESRFFIDHGMTNPLVEGMLKGKIDLNNWKSAIPLSTVKDLSGKINADISFKAKMSDVNAKNYAAIQFNGDAKASNLRISAVDGPKVFIGSAALTANPKSLDFSCKDAKIGSTTLNLGGQLTNILGYFSENKNFNGNFNVDADLIDCNEWLPKEKTSTSATPIPLTFDTKKYASSVITLKTRIGKLKFKDHTADNIIADGSLNTKGMNISNLSATMDGSDIAVNGNLYNLIDYFLNGEMMTGEINLASNNLDANKFMVQSDKTIANESQLKFDVPANLNLIVNTNLKNVNYTNLKLKNIQGKTTIKNQEIIFNDLTGEVLGGKVGFDGLYATHTGEKPKFNVKLMLNKIDFHQAFEHFVTMQALAPVSKYIQGVFNTTLVMDGNLDEGMVPDYSSLNASGLIETLNGAIKNLKPLNDLGERLGIEILKKLNLENTKNWFDIKNGYVELKPFEKWIDGIQMNFSGKHQIKGGMNFDIIMAIPRTMLKKNVVTGSLEKGLGMLEKEAAKLGVNIAQGENINLAINLGGTLTSPIMKITPVGSSGKNLQQEVKDEIGKNIEKAKDSIKTIIDQKKQAIKDSLTSVANKEIEKIKEKGLSKAEEAAEIAKEKVKLEVESKVDTLIGKTVTDSIKRKAEDLLKGKKGKDVDQIKDKLKDWNPFKKKKDGG